MIAFIDDHREAHGVEPICKVLPIAPSTYFDYQAKRTDPAKLSARTRRDMILRPKIDAVFEQNHKVYGARKVWLQMNREGAAVARYTVERLMRVMGLHGVIRGKAIRTTTPDRAGSVCLNSFGAFLKWMPASVYAAIGIAGSALKYASSGVNRPRLEWGRRVL